MEKWHFTWSKKAENTENNKGIYQSNLSKYDVFTLISNLRYGGLIFFYLCWPKNTSDNHENNRVPLLYMKYLHLNYDN